MQELLTLYGQKTDGSDGANFVLTGSAAETHADLKHQIELATGDYNIILTKCITPMRLWRARRASLMYGRS